MKRQKKNTEARRPVISLRPVCTFSQGSDEIVVLLDGRTGHCSFQKNGQLVEDEKEQNTLMQAFQQINQQTK